jgi:hypothetical protein
MAIAVLSSLLSAIGPARPHSSAKPTFSGLPQVSRRKLRQAGYIGKRAHLAGFVFKLIARSGDNPGA